jgi:hypothetical protein
MVDDRRGAKEGEEGRQTKDEKITDRSTPRTPFGVAAASSVGIWSASMKKDGTPIRVSAAAHVVNAMGCRFD